MRTDDREARGRGHEAAPQGSPGPLVYLSGLQSAYTPEDGRFTFHNVPVGEHFLDVYRRRGERTRLLVKVLPGQANNVGDLSVP